MNKTTLYQKDSKDRTKIWVVEVEMGENQTDTATIIISNGFVGGKLSPKIIKIDKGKNIGTVKETNPYTQAQAEAKSKIDKQMKKGWVSNPEDAYSSEFLGNDIRQPKSMKAERYDPTKKQRGSKDLDGFKIRLKRVGCQFKWDGIRCSTAVRINDIKKTSDSAAILDIEVRMYTQGGEEIKGMGHIRKSISDAFGVMAKTDTTGVIKKSLIGGWFWIDGELFADRDIMSFNQLNGIVTRSKLNQNQDLKREAQVEYRLYDIKNDMSYESREKIINDYFVGYPSVAKTETTYVVATEENLRSELAKALAAGQEGLMIRLLGVPYRHRRTSELLKYKEFMDDEFKIVGYEKNKSIFTDDAGKEHIMLGKFLLEIEIDGKIETFKAKPDGKHEQWVDYWVNREDYIGMIATTEFFEYSEFGIPRFPTIKGFKTELNG